MSFPHFYQADEKFVSAIEGMHPNKEYHETFVDINPLTGVILRAAKRFQINVYVRKLDDFIETGNIQTLVFPVMYINEVSPRREPWVYFTYGILGTFHYGVCDCSYV